MCRDFLIDKQNTERGEKTPSLHNSISCFSPSSYFIEQTISALFYMEWNGTTATTPPLWSEKFAHFWESHIHIPTTYLSLCVPKAMLARESSHCRPSICMKKTSESSLKMPTRPKWNHSKKREEFFELARTFGLKTRPNRLEIIVIDIADFFSVWLINPLHLGAWELFLSSTLTARLHQKKRWLLNSFSMRKSLVRDIESSNIVWLATHTFGCHSSPAEYGGGRWMMSAHKLALLMPTHSVLSSWWKSNWNVNYSVGAICSPTQYGKSSSVVFWHTTNVVQNSPTTGSFRLTII